MILLWIAAKVMVIFLRPSNLLFTEPHRNVPPKHGVANSTYVENIGILVREFSSTQGWAS